MTTKKLDLDWATYGHDRKRIAKTLYLDYKQLSMNKVPSKMSSHVCETLLRPPSATV